MKNILLWTLLVATAAVYSACAADQNCDADCSVACADRGVSAPDAAPDAALPADTAPGPDLHADALPPLTCSATHVAAADLLAHWSFDDGSGHDCGGKGAHHGIVYGDPLVVTGVSGLALQFDGVDDFVEVINAGPLTAPAEASELTVAAWIRVDSTGDTGYTIVSRGIGDAINYNFRLWSGGDGSKWDDNLQFFWRDAADQRWCGQHAPPDSFPPSSAWRYVAAAARWGPSGSVAFFVDGQDHSSIVHDDLCDNSPPLQDASGTTLIMTIGRRIGELEAFKGAIDELRIWKRALSKEEIAQQMAFDGAP